MTELRKCLDCETEKPLIAFNNNVYGRGGLSAYCRECNKLRARKWREENQRAKRLQAGGYRPEPRPISLPIIPCLARIDALLERRS